MKYKAKYSIRKEDLETPERQEEALKRAEWKIKDDLFKKIVDSIGIERIDEDPNYPETGDVHFTAQVVVLPIEHWQYVKQLLKTATIFASAEKARIMYEVINEIENK